MLFNTSLIHEKIKNGENRLKLLIMFYFKNAPRVKNF